MRVSTRQFAWLAGATTAALITFSILNHDRPTTVSAAGAEPVPVLVELFTSEGCSSCPPADALLAKLDTTQPVPGAHVIVLSEHVTYWNSLGWRDPFSSEAMTDRQHHYADRFGLSEVYTPQAVVDGQAELVGSEERTMLRAISKAASSPKAPLSIENAQITGSELKFAVHGSDQKSQLIAALAEDGTQSSVLRGENGGRTLHHVAVVRQLESLGTGAADGRQLTLKLPPGAGPLRLVMFQVDRHTGQVTALAEQTIPRI